MQTQGTGCNCFGFAQPYQVLAPPSRSDATAFCDEYLIASSIIYEFRDQSSNPTIRERIAWEVSRGGNAIHAFAPTQ